MWRYEAYWVLWWALGYIDTLDYPNHICDVPAAASLLSRKSFEEFSNGAKLRPQSEVLDQAELIYRYHWASRNALISNKPPPAGLDNSVIMERLSALNWLIEDTDWDDISTDT